MSLIPSSFPHLCLGDALVLEVSTERVGWMNALTDSLPLCFRGPL